MLIRGSLIFLLCLGVMGCSVKKVVYTGVGTAAGAGIGYSYHKDPKEAAIGGAAGGAAGAIVATVQENTENNDGHRHQEFGNGKLFLTERLESNQADHAGNGHCP